MADIHIVTGNGIDKWTIIAHYPVPDVLNEVSVSYRIALVNSRLGGTSQLVEGTEPGQITTAELAQLAAGELFEFAVSFYAESGATNNTELVAAVRAEYAKHQTREIDSLKGKLKYFGWSGAAT